MPHTSYALFNATRNHTITSPNVVSSVRHGVPNACNLCHLDKTLAWTQDTLSAWYQHESMQLTKEQQQVSAAVLWTLKGDAAQRVILAWHFGWQAAKQTSSPTWFVPVLSQLLRDPYGVVRHVAERSIRSLPEAESLQYDFLGGRQQYDEAIASLQQQWITLNNGRQRTNFSPTVLIDRSGVRNDQIKRLLGQRDDRPVAIKE